jgi:LmbE family N-acetylglucosaminyl deacetylase
MKVEPESPVGGLLTRQEFLLSLGMAALPLAAQPTPPGAGEPRILLVVAHPDDEYTFAATAYRIAKELHGTVDQVVVTNGESGYRYSQLAEGFYQASLTEEHAGRSRLPEIRRKETLAAGRILGIRQHYFLEQPDTGFTLSASDSLRAWDTRLVLNSLNAILSRDRYDFVFTMLPSEDTHGHHKAATLLALQAVEALPAGHRPVVLAGDPARSSDTIGRDRGPVFRFDRNTKFGFHDALTYQIVVNWMIAEHKSQGLFQTDCNRHDEERYWLLSSNDAAALDHTRALFASLTARGRL